MRGELETEQNCNILTPTQLFWLLQHFFPVFLGCWDMVLIPASSLQLIWTSSSPRSYNNLTSTYFLRVSYFTLNSTRRQTRLSPDIFDWMQLLFTQVHFSSDSSVGSEVIYATHQAQRDNQGDQFWWRGVHLAGHNNEIEGHPRRNLPAMRRSVAEKDWKVH